MNTLNPAGILWRMSKHAFLQEKHAKGHGGMSHIMFSTFRLILLTCCVPLLLLTTPQAQADSVRLPKAEAPTNHIEQQQQAALCANHAQSIIDRLQTTTSDDDAAFRHEVINALNALSMCRRQDAQAMEHRNNAQVGAPAKYSEL